MILRAFWWGQREEGRGLVGWVGGGGYKVPLALSRHFRQVGVEGYEDETIMSYSAQHDVTRDQLLITMGIVHSPADREAKQRRKILMDQRRIRQKCICLYVCFGFEWLPFLCSILNLPSGIAANL